MFARSIVAKARAMRFLELVTKWISAVNNFLNFCKSFLVFFKSHFQEKKNEEWFDKKEANMSVFEKLSWSMFKTKKIIMMSLVKILRLSGQFLLLFLFYEEVLSI